MAVNLNTKFADAMLKHGHMLARVENSTLKKLLPTLKQAKKDILQILRTNSEFLPTGTSQFQTLTPYQRDRLEQVVQEIDDILRVATISTGRNLELELMNLADRETSLIARLLNQSIPKAAGLTLGFNRLPVDVLAQMVSTPLGGLTYQHRLAKTYGDTLDRIRAAMTDAIIQGRPIGHTIKAVSFVLDDALKNRAATLVRTEMARVTTQAHLATFRANEDVIDRLVWIATLDKRTCFPAGTMVMTEHGNRPIETIRIGDKVLTRKGYKKVTATFENFHKGDLVTIKTPNGEVTSTLEHPFWVERNNWQGWLDAKDIQVGDSLCQLFMNKVDLTGSTQKVTFFNSNNLYSLANKKNIFSIVPLNVFVPVLSVNFKCNTKIGKEEVNRVSTNFSFLNEVDFQQSKCFTDNSLNRCLSFRASITRNRTIFPGMVRHSQVSRNYPKLFSTSQTSAYNWGTSANLRTILPIAPLLVNAESFATPFAFNETIPSTFTLYRANLIPISIGSGNLKRLLTDLTNFCDFVANNRQIASTRAIGSLSSLYSTKRAIKNFIAGMANSRLLGYLGFVITLRRAIGSLGWRFLDSIISQENCITFKTSKFFTQSKINIPEHLGQSSITVYNLEVEDEHEYYANGILVHNCLRCAKLHGKEFKLDTNISPPKHAACRCVLTAKTKSWRQMGIPEESIPGWVKRDLLNGAKPSIDLDYEMWLGKQSVNIQKEMLGTRRYNLWKKGKIKLSQMASTKKVLTLDELEAQI